jgi:hypothetical protein
VLAMEEKECRKDCVLAVTAGKGSRERLARKVARLGGVRGMAGDHWPNDDCRPEAVRP